jgi:hypothetical protein
VEIEGGWGRLPGPNGRWQCGSSAIREFRVEVMWWAAAEVVAGVKGGGC